MGNVGFAPGAGPAGPAGNDHHEHGEVRVALRADAGRAMNQPELTDFGTRYATAWSSQHPVSLASFYNENGCLNSQGSAPSVGRTAMLSHTQGDEGERESNSCCLLALIDARPPCARDGA